MAKHKPATQRRLMMAIAFTIIPIVACVLVLTLHRQPSTLVTSAGSGSPTSTRPATARIAPTAPTAPTTPGGTATAPPATPLSTTPAITAAPQPPHFDTPEAAMNYLTAAWNSNNVVNLDHVTNPAARAQLAAMHSEAVDLRLDHCTPRPQGDYLCFFHHRYPAGTATTLPGGVGQSVFLAGPAAAPGWYVTVFVSCG